MRKWLKALRNIITFPFRIIARFFRFIIRSIKKFFGRFSGLRQFFTEEPEDSPIGDTFAKVHTYLCGPHWERENMTGTLTVTP